MKHPIIISLLCATFLSACSFEYPQTAEQLNTQAAASSFIKSNTYQVSRSASAVAQSLRAGANKCLNRRTTGVVIGGSHMGAPIRLPTVSDYSTTVRNNSAGGVELEVRMVSLGFKMSFDEPDSGSVIYTANVTSANGGAAVSEAWIMQSFGVNPIAEGVRAWAEGTSTACPEMPR